MKCTRAELVKLQQIIAEGRSDKLVELRRSMAQRASGALPDRPLEDGEFYWHPKFRLALRVYNSGRGIWVCKYRNKRGLERTHGIGSATVINTTMAENAAKLVLGKVAQGEDPQGERAELLARPKITVGKLCEQFFEEMRASPKMSFRTVDGYANSAKRHLGALRDLQADELDAQAVVIRVREIAKHSTYNADQFRAMLASVYNWAKQVYPKTIVLNPVTGTWRPERKPTTGQALTIAELGAIWRACEMLEGMAEPMCRNGHVMKHRHELDGPDDEPIGIRHAAELAGFDNKTLYKAARNGTLALRRVSSRDVPKYDPSRPGAKPTNYTTVGEINRYIDARAMRSRRGDYCKVVRLAMLFGARFGEMAGLRWSEIGDLNERKLHIKTVPDDAPVGHRRIKSRGGKPKDLILYIPDAAAEIIQSVPKQGNRDLLFGSTANGAQQNGELKGELDDLIARNEGASFKWKHHWLRHTFTTRLKEMGVQPYLIEAIVNHALKGEASTYTHTKYLELQKPVLEKWAQLIRDAANRVESDTSNVHLLFGQQAETA
jgi:integrase